ncbi:MAG: hypothetical protein RR659_03335 [Bacilli bacterium]
MSINTNEELLDKLIRAGAVYKISPEITDEERLSEKESGIIYLKTPDLNIK